MDGIAGLRTDYCASRADSFLLLYLLDSLYNTHHVDLAPSVSASYFGIPVASDERFHPDLHRAFAEGARCRDFQQYGATTSTKLLVTYRP